MVSEAIIANYRGGGELMDYNLCCVAVDGAVVK